jgi:hypothetical protein
LTPAATLARSNPSFFDAIGVVVIFTQSWNNEKNLAIATRYFAVCPLSYLTLHRYTSFMHLSQLCGRRNDAKPILEHDLSSNAFGFGITVDRNHSKHESDELREHRPKGQNARSPDRQLERGDCCGEVNTDARTGEGCKPVLRLLLPSMCLLW